MARSLRPLVLAVLASLAFAASAGAASPYDPDGLTFTGGTPSADVVFDQSGTYTFHTDTGEITAPDLSVVRAAGASGSVASGIGYVLVPSTDINTPRTAEFVMKSLTVDSGASIAYTGIDSKDFENLNFNLAIATLHDLDLNSGSAVNANGLGGAGGGPGGRGKGPGGGDLSPLGNCPDAGGAGSFGGVGGDGGNGVPSGGTYGSSDQSQLLYQGSGGGGAGTGCGTTPGGNGGGGVGLIALGTLTVDGSVSADGTPAAATSLSDQGGPGAGSGGAILAMAPHLVLANQSVFEAKGGIGYSTSLFAGSGGGGGGGGVITMVSDQPTSALNFMATESGLGGTASNGGGLGLDGGEGNGGLLSGLPFLKVSGPSSKPAGQTASFTATQAFGNSTFAWDFGDGTTGTGQNPSHTYSAPGSYTVKVTSTLTDSGQTATAQRSVTVTQPAATTPPVTTPTNPPPPAPQPQVHCVVPKLKGLSLKAARKKLTKAHCKLGKVKKPKTRKSAKHKPTLVVAKQSPAAKKTLPSGSKVNVTLAAKKPKHHKRH